MTDRQGENESTLKASLFEAPTFSSLLSQGPRSAVLVLVKPKPNRDPL